MLDMSASEKEEFKRRIKEEADRKRAEMAKAQSMQEQPSEQMGSSQQANSSIDEMRSLAMEMFDIDQSLLSSSEYEGTDEAVVPEIQDTYEEDDIDYEDEDDESISDVDTSIEEQYFSEERQDETTQFSEEPLANSSQNQDAFSDATLRQELEEVKKQNELLLQKIMQQHQELLSTQQFMAKSMQNHTAERQAVFTQQQGFEHLTFEPCTSDFCGQTFKYDRYEAPVQFNKKFERGLSDEDTAQNYIDLCKEVCADIENKFGGWDRITNLAVVSDLLIINSVSYEPVMPNGYADALPFDLRMNITNGQFAWVFDYNLLRKMTNLVNLKFDSADFVYSKVRKDMHIVSGFSCNSLFKACKSLMNLQIGQEVITRANPTAGADLFKRASRAEELYQKCCDNTWTFTKNRWGSIKDVFHDPDKSGLSKVWGITWRGVATVGGLATHVGTKSVGLLGKMGRGIRNIASAVKDNM